MLDLDPPVQLEEVEVAAGEHELRRARARVADRAREGDGGAAHRGAQLGVERGGGGLLEHLLVAALDGAVALAERDDGAVRVAQQLDLDVAGPLDVALAEDRAVSERGRRLPGRRLERLLQVGRRAHDPHPAPTASGGGLDEEGIAELRRLAARDDGHPRLGRDPLRRELVAALPKRLGRRPDPDEAGSRHRGREVRILGEEAVAGMDRVGAGFLRSPDVLLGVEIAGDPHRLIGRACVQSLDVVRRNDGDRGDLELTARPEDAEGDLASVCHQQLPDRHLVGSYSGC